MDLGLQNKVILVSGSDQGINGAVTSVLCAEGAAVVLLGSDETDHQLLENRVGQKIFSVKTGNRSPIDFEKAIQAIIHEKGRIDGLVNTTTVHGEPVSLSGNHSGFTKVLQDHLMPGYLTTHFALPHLIKSKSPIVNISIEHDETAAGIDTHQAAVQGACKALTREWAVELLKYGIRSNAVLVSRMKHQMTSGYVIPAKQDVTKIYDGIAQTVVFLLSRKSSHTTGQLIYVT